MLKSSSASGTSLRAFRIASVFFAAVAIFTAVLFVRALGEREIRTGLLTYCLMCVATAVGLWRVRRWGRSFALVMAMGNAGLGTLALMAVLLSRRGSYVTPAILLVCSVVVAYVVSRPVFNLPEDSGAHHDE